MKDRRRSGFQKRNVDLPEGVTLAEWSLEKNRWQNPRIRCFLGCIRLLDDILESNFAILHCSPRRLKEIWSIVLEVRDKIRDDLQPVLEDGSRIPALAEAVGAAAQDIAQLDNLVLTRLDALPQRPRNDEIDPLRALLCEIVGRMHACVMEALGRIMEADPRSRQDNDYFLSRQFARDVDDAEWLHTSVVRFEKYVTRIDRFRPSSLISVVDHIVAERRLPSEGVWASTELFLDELTTHLVPQLQRMIGLRGIRIEELEIIKSFVAKIPEHCAIVRESESFGRLMVQTVLDEVGDEASAAYTAVRAVAIDRLIDKMRTIDSELIELAQFIPDWRSKLTERRALAFRKTKKS